ncbi:hypothetical protein EGW08_003875 [Elysia chlorotica]|uniref:GDNF/GAS1 domain-containing protein n=1 Tax=Elysia chlorotica TaxID=188477 RepID=A0A3S1A1Q0_ELYCH|nr:hypothetical protein EGW08_003875 [Elysia chlorotica]
MTRQFMGTLFSALIFLFIPQFRCQDEQNLEIEPMSNGRHMMQGDCAVHIVDCDHIAWHRTTMIGYNCSGLVNALQCLRDLKRCVSDVVFRTRYLLAHNHASSWPNSSCPQTLERTFYNNTNMSPCERANQTCLFRYADTLFQEVETHDRDGRNRVCYNLLEYILCLHSPQYGCGSEQAVMKIDLKRLHDEEVQRMHAVGCKLPPLKELDCLKNFRMCRDIDIRGRESVYREDQCESSHRTMQCLIDLQCYSVVELQLYQVSIRYQLSPDCDMHSLSDALPVTSQPCADRISDCVVGYVARLDYQDYELPGSWEKYFGPGRDTEPRRLTQVPNEDDHQETMCSAFIDYAECLRFSSTCYELDGGIRHQLIEDEARRRHLYACPLYDSCAVTGTAAVTQGASWLLLGFLFLRALFF